jgi:PAS domain S-box-containing protein
MKVLLVEDDEDDYILVRDTLSDISTLKFNLEWVTTYESALKELHSGRYDICLLDYRLGWRTALEILRNIDAKACSAPIIIITALGDCDVDREAMQSGAADYLTKGSLTANLLEHSIRYSINRRHTEEALRESEARYRAIVEDQTDLICRFMPDRTISFVNGAYCCFLGRKYEELIGCRFPFFAPDEDCANVDRLIASLSRENPVATCEYRVTTPNGQLHWQQWTMRNIFDDWGRHIETQAVGRDTTERKRMEEALRKSSEQVKIFTYCISHDLRSPIVGIHGLARLLEKQYHSILDERGRKYCDQILKASEQIAVLVDEINAFIKTKEAPLTVEEVDLGEILQTLRAELFAQLNARNIAWLEPEAPPKIRADRLSLLRVFRNLVENALKYGGKQLSEGWS